MRQRRKYTDRDKAAALAALDANAGNFLRTARDLNIPRATLMQWAAGTVSEDVPELRQGKRRELADMFEDLARRSVETALGLQGHEKTTLAMAASAAGIATDKMQLLRQLPTQIIDVSRLTDEQLERLAAGENPNNVLSAPSSGGTGTETPALASDSVQ
jgi:hypothetical protein